MDVTLPDGTVIRGVPDDFTKAQLIDKLARNGYDVSKLTPPFPVTPQAIPPVEQSTADALGKGFLETALGASKAYGGASADTYSRATQQAEESAKTNPIATGTGRVLPVLGATVPAMAAIPAVVGGMGALGAMGASTLLAAPAMSGVQGGSRYSEVLNKTGDEDMALKAGIASGAMAAANVAAPMSAGGRLFGTSLLGRAAEGMGLGAATGIADRAIQNNITDSRPELRQDLLDPVALAFDVVPGSIFGAMSPKHIPVAKVTENNKVNLPPSKEQVTTEQGTQLTQQRDKLASFRTTIEDRLAKAQAKAEETGFNKYEQQAEKYKKQLTILDDKLRSVEADIGTLAGGGKEKPVITVDPETEVTNKLITTKSKANLAASDYLKAEKDGLAPAEVAMKKAEAEQAKVEFDTAKAEFIAFKKEKELAARTSKSDTAVGQEAPVNQGELPPYQSSVTEAPMRTGDAFLPLSEQGKASSVQVAGDPIHTDQINSAFDTAKVRTWSDEAIGNSIGAKEAKLKTEESGQVRSNLQDELNILYDEQAARQQAKSESLQPLTQENTNGLQVKGQEAPKEIVSTKPVVEQLRAELKNLEDLLQASKIVDKNGVSKIPSNGVKRAEYKRIEALLAEKHKELTASDIAQAKSNQEHLDLNETDTSSKKTPDTVIPGLKDAIDIGGWRGGFQHILNSVDQSSPLRPVINALLRNKWIEPNVSYNNAIPGKGKYYPGEESVHIHPDKAANSATTLVHEITHRATSNALIQFEANPARLTSRERMAINQLTKLYEEVKLQPRAAGTIPVSNIHEFLAYGLTHNGFSAYLNTVKVAQKGASALRRFINAVTDLLGFTANEKTAYTELLGIGKTLLEKSGRLDYTTIHAQPRTNIGSGLSSTFITEQKNTQGSLIQALKDGQVGSLGSFANLALRDTFGKVQLKMILDNPVINYVVEQIRRAEYGKTALVRAVTYGENLDVKARVGKRIQSLSHYIDENSVYKTFHNLSDLQGSELAKVSKRFFDEGRDFESIQLRAEAEGIVVKTPTEAWEYNNNSRIKQLQDEGVSKKVIDAYSAQSKAYKTMQEKVNQARKAQGRTPTPMRYDYFHASRKGRFVVGVFNNDLIAHVQSFRTELEAKLFEKKVQGYDPSFTTELKDNQLPKEGVVPLDDQLDIATELFQRLGIRIEDTQLLDIFDKMTATGGKFGKHHEYRQNVTGYAGSEWFKNDAELGKAYKQGMFDWIDEQASIKMKQDIQFDTDHLLMVDPTLKDTDPRLHALASQIRDYGTNSVDGWSKGFDEFVRNSGDTFVHDVAKLFGKSDFVMKVNPVDKTMGVSSTLFYLMTMNNRLAFSLGQAMNAPFAIRQILRDLDVPLLSIMKATAMGTARTAGLVKATPEYAKFMQRMVNESDTLRPQLQNELTKIDYLSADSGKKLSSLLRHLSGTSLAEAGDVLSRYWTANIMYDHFTTNKGLKGQNLLNEASAVVDATMVQYNRSNKAGWVQKSGLVGQGANPLLTYGTAQVGNLVADLSFAAKNGTLRSTVPIISTFVTSALMAGVVSLPILAELQMLRELAVAVLGEEYEDKIPSITRLLQDSPAAVERGIPSAVTGMDVGSTLRWNPFLGNILNGNQSIVDIFPTVAFMGAVGKTMGMMLLDEAGIMPQSKADIRKQVLTTVPGLGGKFVVDALYYDALTRPNVPGGRGAAVVPQTARENLATAMGTSTLPKVRTQAADFDIKKLDKVKHTQQQKAIDLLTDSLVRGGKHGDYARAELARLGIPGDQVADLVFEQVKNMNTPVAVRWMQSGEGLAAQLRKARILADHGRVIEESLNN